MNKEMNIFTKICSKCHLEKDIKMFCRYKNTYQSWCKVCQKEYRILWHEENAYYNHEWYVNNKDSVSQRQLKNYKKIKKLNPEQHLFNSVRSSARS